jgi:hypothetical protein
VPLLTNQKFKIMGSLLIDCPIPDALVEISTQNCAEKFGQIQRAIIRRKQTGNEVSPTFANLADMLALANWEAARDADLDDNIKMVITPFISSLVIPTGEPIKEEGNNNNTVNGIPILQGVNNINVVGRFLNLPASIADEIRELTQHSASIPGFTNLEIFLVNEFGQVICKKTTGTTPVPYGIPVYNLFVGSKGSQGLNKESETPLSFDLKGDWDKNLHFSKPTEEGTPANWNPLTDLDTAIPQS